MSRKSGYISADDLRDFVPAISELPIFLCGPDAMMQAVRKTIVSMGVPNEQIATEEFVSPKGNHSALEESTESQSENLGVEVDSASIRFELSDQRLRVMLR